MKNRYLVMLEEKEGEPTLDVWLHTVVRVGPDDMVRVIQEHEEVIIVPREEPS
jgi:hypothetical protein